MTNTCSSLILQTNFEASLENDIARFAKLDKATITNTFIESLIHELEDEFVASRDRHEKIIVSKQTDASKKYIDDCVFDHIRAKYHKYWASLKAYIPKQTKSEETLFNQSMGTPQCKQFELQLPKMQLPTFDGSYDNWMAFNNLFVAMVHNSTSLEPIQKLQYLKGSLTGDALNVVRNLELTNENYSIARTLLINRFQHTRRLVNTTNYLTFLKSSMKTQKILRD